MAERRSELTVKVGLWNGTVGYLLWHERPRGYQLQIDPEFYKRDLDISPIVMPLEEIKSGRLNFQFPNLSRETYRGLPGLLADSLPDRFGNRMIDVWLKRSGRATESLSAAERLCYVGSRGMGALEYEPSIRPELEKVSKIELTEIAKLAKEVLFQKSRLHANLLRGREEALLDVVKIATSAGGNRAKAVIAVNKKTQEVISGQREVPEGFRHCLLKFDGLSDDRLGDPENYCRIEYAYYLMAKDCGIDMCESRLLEEGERAHFLTERFDRIGNEKLHIQTLCAIAHMDFNRPHSYENAFRAMRSLRLDYPDLENMYKRMVFNVVARNQDDHTKNISFLMDKRGVWRLAPAYDMTYAYNPHGKWTRFHQMSVGGKREEITRRDLVDFAKKIAIKKPDFFIEQVVDSVSKFDKFAKAAGVPHRQVAAIRKTHRLQLCTKR